MLGVTGALGFLLWLFLGLAALVRWGMRWAAARKSLELDDSRTETVTAILGGCVLICSGLLGFVGGIAAWAGAYEWFGPNYGF